MRTGTMYKFYTYSLLAAYDGGGHLYSRLWRKCILSPASATKENTHPDGWVFSLVMSP